ncbi:hypothetical protein ACS0TY_024737 [Phlomoides rotata]
MAITIRNCNSTSVIRERYDVSFFHEAIIYTTVTDNPTAVTNWIDEIKYQYRLSDIIVGLDVEWRPNYVAGRQRNPVAVLQLCVDDLCLIYQIIHTNQIPQSLVDFLSSGYFPFVGVGIKSDLDKLHSDYGIGGGAQYVDLRGLAAEAYGRHELKNAGLKDLARIVLDKEVEKPHAVTTSPWDNRQLTPEQVKYACVDAYMSYKIGSVLGA